MTESKNETRKHIRGSSLLLSGRFISIALNFLVQVISVRILTKADYGAFAYALTIASVGSSIALLSLDKAISRYLPIYDEHEDEASLRGGMILTLLSIIGMSLALILLVYGLQSFIAERMVSDERVVAVLLIVIWTSPVGALDNWFQSIFTVFASPKAIFFRRYLFGPGLKLLAVLVVMFAHAGVISLAIGYVLGGMIGLLAYAFMLRNLIKNHETFKSWKPIRFPFRDIYGFALPLMYSDLVFILRHNVVIILVEFFKDSIAVAEYRAVVPLARLNEVVLHSFTFLYTPLAARLFAKRETEQINDLYWQTALWIIVFSFPVFSLTFSLARPVTILVLGERYADSSIILAILSFGYYFNAALGFNNHTLRVYGVVKYIVMIDFIVSLVAIALGFILIPRYGALGGALTASGTLVLHNLLNHLGLHLHTDVRLFSWKYLKSYLLVVIATIGLLLMQLVLEPSIFISFPAAALVSLIILRLNRKQLNVAEVFPELLKIKPLRYLIGL